MLKSILGHISVFIMMIVMAGCFGSSNPDVAIEELSLNQITASISENAQVGGMLQDSFSLGSVSASVPQITLSGVGSQDFRVNVVAIGMDQNQHTIYRGDIQLVNSLRGKGGITYHLTATASMDGQSITTPVTIRIIDVYENQAPIAKIDTQAAAVTIMIDEGTARTLTSDYSMDPDDGIVYCKWTDGHQLLSEKTFSPSVTEIVSATGCEVDLSQLASGTYTYTLMLKDQGGLSDTNIAYITVNAMTDTAPVAQINSQDSPVSQEIYAGNAPYAMASGSDNIGIVHCKWSDDTNTIMIENDITPAMQYMDEYACPFDAPTLLVAGTYTYTLTVKDTLGQEDSNRLIVRVLANSAPTADIGGNREIIKGQTLDILAVASDSEGDDMTYLWMYGVKDGSTMNGAGTTLNFSHQFNEVGVYIVAFKVLDEHGVSVEKQIEVTVINPSILAPSLSGVPDKSVLWGYLYSFNVQNSGGVATYTIINKPSWADFDAATGSLSGTSGVDDIGIYEDITITASNVSGSSTLNKFSIAVEKRTPPTIMSGAAKDLSMDSFDFPFTDDADWRALVRSVSIVTEYGGLPTQLDSGSDYALGANLFSLKIKESTKVQLHTPIMGGGEIRFEADGYFDNTILIDMVGDGYYGVAVQAIVDSANYPLSEDNLDAAKINITLLNQLQFTDATLATNNFTLDGAPEGTIVQSVAYTSATTAEVTLSFDGTDFDTNGQMTIMIEAEELTVNMPLGSNSVDFTANALASSPYIFSWDDGVHGDEPWVTEGTVESTKLLKDINADANGSSPSISLWSASLNGVLYFAATGTSSTYYNRELWKSDGTTEGTSMVIDLAPAEGHGSHPRDMTRLGEHIYFFALTGGTSSSNNFYGDTGLWKTDGTETGTVRVENFGDFSQTSYSVTGYLEAMGDKLLFQKDYDAGNGSNRNPWVSDGSNLSTLLSTKLEGVNRGFGGGVEFQGSYYAAGSDYYDGNELWKSNATEAGTVMVKDIVLGSESGSSKGRGSNPSSLTVVDENRLFFTAFNATSEGVDLAYDKSLWVSNGTSAGTIMIKDDLATPSNYRDRFQGLTAMGGMLYFVYLNIDEYGNTTGLGKLWKSDGSSSGTTLLKDLDIEPLSMGATENSLYFWSSGLWKSDGTLEGTVKVKDFASTVYADRFVFKNGLLYFQTEDYSMAKREMWRSDGSANGTFILVEKNLPTEEY